MDTCTEHIRFHKKEPDRTGSDPIVSSSGQQPQLAGNDESSRAASYQSSNLSGNIRKALVSEGFRPVNEDHSCCVWKNCEATVYHDSLRNVLDATQYIMQCHERRTKLPTMDGKHTCHFIAIRLSESLKQRLDKLEGDVAKNIKRLDKHYNELQYRVEYGVGEPVSTDRSTDESDDFDLVPARQPAENN